MEQSGMLRDMEASRPFCSIFVVFPRIPTLHPAPSFLRGEKWHLEHSGMGGESLKDSLTIHWCIWGKGMTRNWDHQPWAWWHNPGTIPISPNPL